LRFYFWRQKLLLQVHDIDRQIVVFASTVVLYTFTLNRCLYFHIYIYHQIIMHLILTDSIFLLLFALHDLIHTLARPLIIFIFHYCLSHYTENYIFILLLFAKFSSLVFELALLINDNSLNISNLYNSSPVLSLSHILNKKTIFNKDLINLMETLLGFNRFLETLFN